MTFAKSLRVIGQSLEVAKVLEFKLEGDGRNFMVQSDSMSRTAEWMLRYAGRENDISPLAGRRSASDIPLELKPVEFSDADIARLNAREAQRRREFSTARTELSTTKLSQLLRILGDHLDRSSARTFHIFWMRDSIVVDYRRTDGLAERQRFTTEKLLQSGHSGQRRLSLTSKN
jgi:hypothetical protein